MTSSWNRESRPVSNWGLLARCQEDSIPTTASQDLCNFISTSLLERTRFEAFIPAPQDAKDWKNRLRDRPPNLSDIPWLALNQKRCCLILVCYLRCRSSLYYQSVFPTWEKEWFALVRLTMKGPFSLSGKSTQIGKTILMVSFWCHHTIGLDSIK